MRNLLVILLSLFTLSLSGQVFTKSGGNFMGSGGKFTYTNKTKPIIYYVSTSGSDANSGLDSLHPWLTLAYAETNATATGAIIALSKGDTFLIDNVIDVNSGGTVNNYKIWDGGLWGTGPNATIQANSDGGSAPKYYSLFRIAACDYVIVQNINFFGNDKNRWAVTIGGDNTVHGPTAQSGESNIIIQDCTIKEFGTGAYYCHGITVETWNNDITDIIIQRDTISGVGAQSVSLYSGRSVDGGTPATTDNVYVGYCYFTNFGRMGSLGAGVMINNRITDCTVEHNTIITGASGYGVGVSISSNETTLGYFPTNAIIRYNDIRTTTRGAILAQHGQAKTALVHTNLLYSSAPNTGVVYIEASPDPLWTNALLRFYNNTIVHADAYGLTCNSNGTNTVEFINNIVVRNAENSDEAMANINPSSPLVHNNNLYYRTSGTRIWVIEGSSKFAADQATVEATSVLADPTLTDLAGFDWTLQAGSPAINTGVDVGLTVDYAGNPIDATPDIGAYEKQ